MSEDKVTIVCKRGDFKGSFQYAEQINQLFEDGYKIELATDIRNAPRLYSQVRLNFVKKGSSSFSASSSISSESRSIIDSLGSPTVEKVEVKVEVESENIELKEEKAVKPRAKRRTSTKKSKGSE